VGELGGDVAAAHDDHAGRQLVEAHDRVRGVVADAGLGDRRGDHRAGAGGQHDPVGGDPGAVVDGQLVRAGKAGPPLDQRHRIRLSPAAASRGGVPVGLGERPVPDGRPVDPGELDLDPELGCAAYLSRDLGGLDQHLARDAPPVNARAAERARLDQRDGPLGAILGHQVVAGTRADDHE
jgi:hypothetical protein